MLTLGQLLSQLNFIPQDALLLGLFLTGAIILVVRDWRLLILALLWQYILLGLVLARLVQPEIAALKVMIGTFICLILFLSVRQVMVSFSASLTLDPYPRPNNHKWLAWWRKVAEVGPLIFGSNRHRGLTATGFLFRCFSALLMMYMAFLLGQSLTLPGLTWNITATVYWLLLAGLTILILNEDPLKMGLGLFTFFIGFDLFYTTIEGDFLLIGLWGSVNLLIALVTGYLLVVKGTAIEEES